MNREIPVAVDLESYSSSNGWLGFFELSTGARREHVHLLVDWFVGGEFGIAAVDVYTNAHVFDSIQILQSEYSLSDSDVNEFLRPLIASGSLQTYEHYSQVGTPASLSKISADDLKRLLVCQMDVDGIFGHVFVYLIEHDLLVYPHDDVGFGFISGSFRGEALANDLVSRLPVLDGPMVDRAWKVSRFRHPTYPSRSPAQP